jgi:putative transposase
VSGRKRHILVDTLGLLLVVVVHAADIQDSDGAKLVLRKALGRFPQLRKIWVDQGYKAHFVAWAQAVGGWVVETVKRPEGVKGFRVLPRRWVVERTFAWLGRCRRLSKDYEGLPETGEAWIQVAMIHLMLKRLAPP